MNNKIIKRILNTKYSKPRIIKFNKQSPKVILRWAILNEDGKLAGVFHRDKKEMEMMMESEGEKVVRIKIEEIE